METTHCYAQETRQQTREVQESGQENNKDKQEVESFLERLTPYVQKLKHMIYGATRSFLSSFDGLEVDPIELGIDDGLIKKVLISYQRDIEKNEHPTGEKDQYLVKDSFKVGFRVGGGLVVSGDVAFTREYTLVSPVQSRAEGETQNNFVFNLLLPYQVIKNHLPKKYALVISDSLEGRGRVKLGNALSFLGNSLSFSQINLGRTFISKKDENKVYVFEDSSLFSEIAYRINAELGLIDIPLFRKHIRQGSLDRKYYRLSLNNQSHREALRKVRLLNSTRGLEKIAHEYEIDDTFFEYQRRSNFLGLFQAESKTRHDNIVEIREDRGDNFQRTLTRRFQMEQLKRRSLSVFNHNENFKTRILLRGRSHFYKETKRKSFEGLDRPQLEIQVFIDDKQTTKDELKKYLAFINEVSLDQQYIPFAPEMLVDDKRWGKVQVALSLQISHHGLENILSAKEEDFWNTLEGITTKPASYWAKALKTNMRNRRHLDVSNRDIYLASKLNIMARHTRNFNKEHYAYKRMRSMHAIFTQTLYSSDQAYRGTLLAVLHEIAGKENVYLEAFVDIPKNNDESDFAEDGLIYKSSGFPLEDIHPYYQFYFDHASEIYNAF